MSQEFAFDRTVALVGLRDLEKQPLILVSFLNLWNVNDLHFEIPPFCLQFRGEKLKVKEKKVADDAPADIDFSMLVTAIE